MDDPQSILDGALANHLNLIRQFKGNNFRFFLECKCDVLSVICLFNVKNIYASTVLCKIFL